VASVGDACACTNPSMGRGIALGLSHAVRLRTPEPPSDVAGVMRAALFAAMPLDADVFRAGLEIIGCLALPQEVFARPGFADRVLALAEAADGAPAWGPDREALLRLVA